MLERAVKVPGIQTDINAIAKLLGGTATLFERADALNHKAEVERVLGVIAARDDWTGSEVMEDKEPETPIYDIV